MEKRINYILCIQDRIILICAIRKTEMNFWNNLRHSCRRILTNPELREFMASPIPKIVAINTAMFLLWRIKGVSETFLVRHFSYDRFNIKENRFHTMITYAFSHFSSFRFIFDMITFATFGRGIRLQFGNRIIWWLYLLGAFGGGLSMYFGMPSMPTVVPQVGCDASLAAMVTFYGLLNLHKSAILFVFPVKMWMLLGMMGVYSMVDPEKKTIGGIFAGLLLYQFFKIKII